MYICISLFISLLLIYIYLFFCLHLFILSLLLRYFYLSFLYVFIRSLIAYLFCNDIFFKLINTFGQSYIFYHKIIEILIKIHCYYLKCQCSICEKIISLIHCRFELLDYITKNAHTRAKGIPLQCLIDSAKEVRSAVLELVQAARSVFSNPFDFLSKQTLDNSRNIVGMFDFHFTLCYLLMESKH